MAVPASPAGRRPRLADRLAAARRRRFVGREAELALFGSALAGPEPPFALLYVHGPGGVGKTLLLGEFARLAGEAGVPAVRLDGRDLDPSPPGFLAGLGRALDEPPTPRRWRPWPDGPAVSWMVDTYETLGPLDAWLGTVHVEPAGPQDREAVLAMVRRHEGEASARIAEHWWRRQPEAFATFRGPPVRRPARPGPARRGVGPPSLPGRAPTATRARGRPGTCWPPPGPWSG
jgi:AAA ATPase domain